MSGDEVNPAAEAQPVVDVQGDERWMSQVGGVCLCVYLKLFIVYLPNPDHYAIIRMSASISMAFVRGYMGSFGIFGFSCTVLASSLSLPY